MRHVLAMLCAVRVALAFSPPLFTWWRENRRRLRSQNRPCNDFPSRAYRHPR